MEFPFAPKDEFILTIEAVPPAGHDSTHVIDKMKAIADLDFHAFSVASNPVAKPRMSAMVFCSQVKKATGKPAILHLTVRDHNRLGLQSELSGARALGIDTLIAVTGDPSAPKADPKVSTVGDVTVFELMAMAREHGFFTGGVLDFRPEVNGLDHEAFRLEKKAAAGCEFIVTQPVYDQQTARQIHDRLDNLNLPVIMGILPLLSFKHASFLHDKVAGIAVPDLLRDEMNQAAEPTEAGIANARQMLELARKYFSGACIMPPFDRFDILPRILT